MAYTASHTAHIAPLNLFARATSAIGSYLVRYVEMRSRYTEVQALEQLSDKELAARGLTRESIVRHVFADRLYL